MRYNSRRILPDSAYPNKLRQRNLMKLLVIILNYRVTDLAIECLRSIAPEISSVPGMRVAICENGTGGDAEQQLRNAITSNGWAHWAELTAISPNRGFTGGNNVIIRKALAMADQPEYFLLLNADTVVRPGALATLVEFMEGTPMAGIAAGRLEDPDGSDPGSAQYFYTVASEFDRALRLGLVSRMLGRKSLVFPMPTVPKEVDWVPGTCMIIRRKVIESIGPLDEGFYTYFDDIDYCWNARRAGWAVWFVPQSRVLHVGGASTGVTRTVIRRRPRYWFQARRRYWLKNYGPMQAALGDGAFIVGYTLWRIRRFVQRKVDTDPPNFLADFIRNSVFLTGFKLKEVENPAMIRESTTPRVTL